MAIAVIKTGGKQYKVQKDDIIDVELLDVTKKTFIFDDILDGKKVSAELVDAEVKGPKVRIMKFKNKTRYIKRKGHRQRYSQIKITDIK